MHTAEDTVASVCLVLVAVLPAAEIALRNCFKTGILGSAEYMQHLVVWITFIGAMITSRQNKHINLSVIIDHVHGPWQRWLQSGTAMVAVCVGSCLCMSSYSFITMGLSPTQKVGVFPIVWIMAIMPIGFAIITIRSLLHTPKGIVYKITAAAGIGLAFAVKYAFTLLGSLTLWPAIIGLIFCAFLGLPLFLVLSALACLLFYNASGMTITVANEAYTMLTNPIIPTIPLFTMVGIILSESKTSTRFVDLFRALFGWFPGGFAVAAIIICTFFTSITGASGVTILALGGLLLHVLQQNHYPKNVAIGLLTVNGGGTLFPPSLPLIMYAVVGQVDIQKMFLGGLLPGTLMIVALIIYTISVSYKKKITRIPFNGRLALAALKVSAWELLLPFIICILFFMGIITIVETSAIAVIYIFIIEVIVHRDIPLRKFPRIVASAIPITASILIILAAAKGLSYFIVDAEIPTRLTAYIQNHIHSPYLFLFLLNIVLIVIGCFMDIYSAIIVIVPLIIPLASVFGIHPVHLGVIFLANLEIGYLTPLVGLNLFLSSLRFNEPVISIYRSVWPFIVVLAISVLLITYIPTLSTALPSLIGR
ncbi:MAG: TRAP transporter large permease subunit [Chitinivibrionales bacterium]|nr:TRAP transporter large permease subunit [Chitinivibrionales bacterium]